MPKPALMIPAMTALAFCASMAHAADQQLTCRFDRQIDETGETSATDYQLTYQYSEDSPEAFVVVNDNALPVIHHGGARAVSFVNALPSGLVLTTTINLADNKAVHARSDIRDGAMRAHLFLGHCAPA